MEITKTREMEMQEEVIGENGLTYHREGDVLIPDIALKPVEKKPLGKYGSMRRKFLKEHRHATYVEMKLTEELFPHLWEVQETAARRLETMIPKLAEQYGVTEELKRKDPLKWAAQMNNLKAMAEETIYNELIFV